MDLIVTDDGVKTHSLMTRHLVWPDSAPDTGIMHIQAYTDMHMYNHGIRHTLLEATNRHATLWTHRHNLPAAS